MNERARGMARLEALLPEGELKRVVRLEEPVAIMQNAMVALALLVRMGSRVVGGTDRSLALLAEVDDGERGPLPLAILDDGRTDWAALNTLMDGRDVELHRVPLRGRFDPAGAAALARLAARQGASVLHSWDYKADFYAAAAALRSPLAWVVTLNGTPPRTPALRFYEHLDRRLVRRADAVFCVSRELARRCGPTCRARVVPNPVSPPRFPVRTSVARPRRLVAIGRLEHEKGFDLLLEALCLARSREPDLSLVVVGDGPGRAELTRRAARGDLGHAVTFTGWSRSPEAHLAEADLFVLPSRTEHQPLALLEAIRSGLPVVASRAGDVPEMVDPSCALLVPPGDVAALADALVEAASRTFATGAAAERVLHEHAPGTVATIYETEYRRSTAARRRGERP